MFIISFISAHNPDQETIEWKQYFRIGTVYSEDSNIGYAGYGRLKRSTEYTFKDIRFFGHFFNKDTEIRIRQKSSRRFLTFDNIYSFNTLTFEKNTILNVDLRYHYNQGIGLFLQKGNAGNTTLEMGLAFDNSDYLNTEQKTAYIRSGCSLDRTINQISTKLEIDYFYQISEIVDSASLSRYQILGEWRWSLNINVGFITGFTWDIQNTESNPSVFFTISYLRLIDWTF